MKVKYLVLLACLLLLFLILFAIPDISNLVKNTDHDAKTSDIGAKYFTTSDKKVTFTLEKIMNIYINYEVRFWPLTVSEDFA